MTPAGIALLLVTSPTSSGSAFSPAQGSANDNNRPLLTWFLQNVRDDRSRGGVAKEYGVSQVQFEECVYRIRTRMLSAEFDHDSELSIEGRAKAIEAAVDEEIAKSLKPSSLLRERLVYQGLYEWIRFHFRYSTALTKPDAPKSEVAFYWVPKNVMAMRSPSCVCVGYALTMVMMAKYIGLECRPVNGFARRAFDSSKLPASAVPDTWHKWVVLRQKDGLLVPADPTNSSVGLEYARRLKPTELDARCTLPSAPEDWSVYNAVYYSSVAPETHKELGSDWQVSSLDYGRWKGVDIQILRRQYLAFTGSTLWKTCLSD